MTADQPYHPCPLEGRSVARPGAVSPGGPVAPATASVATPATVARPGAVSPREAGEVDRSHPRHIDGKSAQVLVRVVALVLAACAGCTSGPAVTTEGTPSASAAQAAPPPSAGPTATGTATATATGGAASKLPPVPVDPPIVRLPAGAFHQGKVSCLAGKNMAWRPRARLDPSRAATRGKG